MSNYKFKRLSLSDKALLTIGYLLLGLFVAAIIVPLCYVIIASFMDPNVLQNQGVIFDFSKWTVMAYKKVLENKMIWTGFINSIFYSVAFTAISVGVTILAAYPMSKKDFVGKGFFQVIFMITMFFGGGLIPTYLVVSNLNLVDTPWAIILPGAFNVWNMILARTYYQSLPGELREASAVDGASELVHFLRSYYRCVSLLLQYLPCISS